MIEWRERFWARVRKSDGCWLWTAARSKAGYGQLGINRKVYYVHRLSYEMHHGAIPPKYHVCHSCDVKECVRPDHLFVGTASDNLLDAHRKGLVRRANAEKSHCIRGHPFSGDNLYRYRGHRSCRECRRVQLRESRRRRREMSRYLGEDGARLVAYIGVDEAPGLRVVR